MEVAALAFAALCLVGGWALMISYHLDVRRRFKRQCEDIEAILRA